MCKLNSSSNHEYGTLDYYHHRVLELEKERDSYNDESKYYQKELAKAHEILGRVIHQLSESWDSVNLTKYYPTDNLWGKRTCGNPKGKKIEEV